MKLSEDIMKQYKSSFTSPSLSRPRGRAGNGTWSLEPHLMLNACSHSRFPLIFFFSENLIKTASKMEAVHDHLSPHIITCLQH